jgi:hypothetical protein
MGAEVFVGSSGTWVSVGASVAVSAAAICRAVGDGSGDKAKGWGVRRTSWGTSATGTGLKPIPLW